MIFLRKSIIRKLFIDLLFFCLTVIALSFVYFYFAAEKSLPFNYFLIVLGVFLISFLIIYYFDVLKPLNIILAQMQAILAGKPHKRIYTDRVDEIGIIAHFFNQVTKGLGSVGSDMKDRDRILGELDIASELQRDILPTESPMIKGLQVVAKNKPATELGGDSFNFFESGNKYYIYIGDVTGHGIAGGLIMSMVDSLINVFTEMYGSAYDILLHVNRFVKQHIKKAMFMTLVMLSWDQEKQVMTYVGAGHEHILVYRAATGECEAIVSGGIALGMVLDNSKLIKETVVPLGVGDFVVLYTDGITEARNVNDELFGLDRLKQLVEEYAAKYSAEGVNYHIAKDVSSFISGATQLDDITLITIKRYDIEKESVDVNVKDRSTNWSE
ncbi:MAG: SpoIIE family protein phosphatase [bacterium]|nr:SpoIIE family protein phosphatase [bacterium]